MTKQDPMFTAIERAYKYFPYGFDGIQHYNGWVCGPTFAVKTAGEFVGTMASLGIYKQDPRWQDNLEVLIGSIDKATEVVAVDDVKHAPNCTGRAIHNSQGNEDEFPMELAYPLYMLGKKMRIDEWRRSGIVVYGFRNGECNLLLSARYMYAKAEQDDAIRKVQPS